MRRIEIEIGGIWVENPVAYIPGVIASATLLGELAPRTCQALWDILPIETRTIHTYRAGQNWRTEGNYQLVPRDAPVENPVVSVEPGDIYYMNNHALGLLKIFICYGLPSGQTPTYPFSLIAKVDENLEGLIAASRRILYEGPKPVAIRRRE